MQFLGNYKITKIFGQYSDKNICIAVFYVPEIPHPFHSLSEYLIKYIQKWERSVKKWRKR
jgi:hypothetical protein